MIPFYSIGRAGAAAGTDGTSASAGANRPSGASFGKSLEYVIDANRADQQRFVGGIGGPTADIQQTSAQAKPLPLAPRMTVSSANASAAGITIPQRPPGAIVPQPPPDVHRHVLGTLTAGEPDTAPSTLDPISMAFLLAWMGGGGDGQSVHQQQQNYLEFYRLTYPNGVPGGSGPASATLNFLTQTS